MEPKRQFKGVWIPAEIMDNRSLSAAEKMLLAEIFSLTGQDGCFASNAYLAEKIGLSESRTAHMVSKLRDGKHIIDVNFDGRKRYIKVCWDTVKLEPAFQDCKPSSHENSNPALSNSATLPCRIQQPCLVEFSNIDISIENSIDSLSKDKERENEFSLPVDSLPEKKEKREKRTGPPVAPLDFDRIDQKYLDMAVEWVEYRAERNPPVKSQRQLEAWAKLLEMLCGGNMGKARLILDTAIGNGWQGIQPIKNQSGQNEKSTKGGTNADQLREWYGEL